MRLLRKLAVIASGVAMVAGMGVVYAGAASANSTPTELCVTDTQGITFCAQVETGSPNPYGDNYGGADWYYPTPGSRTIRDSANDQCMLVDTGADAYDISMHTCDSSTLAQLFNEVPIPGGMEFFSDLNDMCLAYNADTGGYHLFSCNDDWYETFST
jgi:hypothetical protein